MNTQVIAVAIPRREQDPPAIPYCKHQVLTGQDEYTCFTEQEYQAYKAEQQAHNDALFVPFISMVSVVIVIWSLAWLYTRKFKRDVY